MEQSSGASAPGGNASQGVAAETSLRGWFYVIGFLGLAIALASIADMFSTRPYDGIVPAPYSRKGIDVRATTPGGPAAQAGIPAGDCVLGIGRHNVNSISDASTELRKHRVGESVPYLVRRGPCPSGIGVGEPTGEVRTFMVKLSAERLGGKTYLYASVLGFLFFFIGLFVFRKHPEHPAGSHEERGPAPSCHQRTVRKPLT